MEFSLNFFFRVYLWLDDKGKKITKTNVSAPQYIDYVMTCCHNYLHDDAVFPTKYGEFIKVVVSLRRHVESI